ncbi:MAG: 50S ribosomal protein L19e [Candidatus Micrarchaeota archaeon]|nr:50S ribosomal protein L19e [Candidatus Micrarchaeota archaeon]
MAMNTVRRIAAQILSVGESKVKFSTEATSKIGEALTREDVRALIKDGSIYALQKQGVSRIRGRAKQEQARKGRRGGKGSKKGTHAARLHPKTAWIAKVRSQRKLLRSLIDNNKLADGSSRKIYLMIKGNAFKGVKVLETYLKDNKHLK